MVLYPHADGAVLTAISVEVSGAPASSHSGVDSTHYNLQLQ